MGRRSNIFYITTVIVAIACLVLDLVFPNNSFSFLGICFALTMLAYGFCLIIRGFAYKIDSSLFLGIIIFSFGVITTLTYVTAFSYLDLWHYILLSVSLACAITGIHFNVSTHKRFAILFLVMFVLALLYQSSVYKIWVMLVLMLVAFVAYIIINNILHNRRK